MNINPNLLKEIDTKKRKIRDNPALFLKMHNRMERDLRQLGDLHSFWLENPQLRERLLVAYCASNEAGIRRQARLGIDCIQCAWSYLNSLNGNGRLVGQLSPQIVIEVGKRVEPINTGYRDVRVSLGFARYTPPNYVKVSERVEDLCRAVNELDLHPAELAAMTHLGIAGIQPFRDGNKRTARILQDKILRDAGLPPAIIPYGERTAYLDLLENALSDMVNGEAYGQSMFGDYIGSKVNVELDNVLGDLNSSCPKNRRSNSA